VRCASPGENDEGPSAMIISAATTRLGLESRLIGSVFPAEGFKDFNDPLRAVRGDARNRHEPSAGPARVERRRNLTHRDGPRHHLLREPRRAGAAPRSCGTLDQTWHLTVAFPWFRAHIRYPLSERHLHHETEPRTAFHRGEVAHLGGGRCDRACRHCRNPCSHSKSAYGRSVYGPRAIRCRSGSQARGHQAWGR
jgi:hypothetical protein